MTEEKSGTLSVPNASLYYKTRGAGPMLLALPGDAADADGFDATASHLADRYTVVTYDRRGLSRSERDNSADIPGIEAHTDDVHRLLSALTSEPVLVFGSSIGAFIGLDLVARHPEQVRALIAHEPPAPQLLPDAERAAAERLQLDAEETFRLKGWPAAIQKFLEMTGTSYDDREPDAELPRPNSQAIANIQVFLKEHAGAVRRHTLDIDAIAAAPTQIVPAAGRASRHTWLYRCVVELAARLGTSIEDFPGGHAGYVSHPREFAARLRAILDSLPGK